jgi:periplasmic nitrate reductase NapE
MEIRTTSNATPTRSQERRAFILLAVVLAPVLAVMFVGGYGLIVWLTQIIFGPPGSG